METIAEIVARQLEVALDVPLWVGGYAIVKRDYCHLTLRTNEGRCGYALAFSRGRQLASVAGELAARRTLGCEPWENEKIWDEMYKDSRLNGRQGLLMRAVSLVDLALWDLKAKRVGMPVHRLLGGYRSAVPVLMAGGYYRKDKGPDELVEEFRQYAARGFRHLKLMVGGASMREDLARFVAVRRALPDHVELGVDANGSWEDAWAVRRWIEEAQAAGGPLSFVEEPLPPEQTAGMRWLREHGSARVASGEFVAGRWAFKELIDGQAVDIVRADATLCGGITEWKRILALCETAHVPVIPHYYPSIHVHLAAAFPGCGMIETVDSAGNNSSTSLLMGCTYTLRDGCAAVGTAPGFGYEQDESLIRASTVQETVIRA